MSSLSKKSKMNWVDGIDVAKCGNGWFVRLAGADIFDSINEHGCKARRTLSIAESLTSEEEAKKVAIEWLNDQINRISK